MTHRVVGLPMRVGARHRSSPQRYRERLAAALAVHRSETRAVTSLRAWLAFGGGREAERDAAGMLKCADVELFARRVNVVLAAA